MRPAMVRVDWRHEEVPRETRPYYPLVCEENSELKTQLRISRRDRRASLPIADTPEARP